MLSPPAPPSYGCRGGSPNKRIRSRLRRPVGAVSVHACYFSSFFFQRVAAALRARAFRWACRLDAAAFFPPLLPRSARYFLIAAGSRFAIRAPETLLLRKCSEIPYAYSR
jgi:hypothetical protein